jgi:hypothetical protein
VALGSTRPKAKYFRAHRLTRHGGKGSLRCEVTTWMARFDTPFMGKWRRTGSRRLDGTLICRGQGRQAAREERGQRRSRQGGSVVVAGLTKTVARCRCSLQHPAPWSAPASHPLWTAPAPLPATGPAPHEHRRSPVLAHQQRHGVRLPPSPLLLSSLTPLFSFPTAANIGKGENPN